MVDVPAQYQGDVQSAARATGLPYGVVAAQIWTESRFDPTATSPAGAEGIAQFEPGTWAKFGKGSPFNVKDSFNAYDRYMSYLLGLEHGNVQDALAAYNAGPANLKAGMGYADAILAEANQPVTITTPRNVNVTTDSAPVNPLDPGSWLGGLASAFGSGSVADLLERAGLIVLGAGLVIAGLVMFGRTAGIKLNRVARRAADI